MPSDTGFDRAVEVLWVRLPLSLARFATWPTALLSDGLWLTRWPLVALAAPPAAAVAGFGLGLVHPGVWLGQLLVIVAVVYAAVLLAGKLGWWATAGFLAGYLIDRFARGGYQNPGVAIGAALLGTALLALLLVLAPLLVAAVVSRAAALWGKRVGRVVILAVVALVTAGAAGLAWSQSVAVLSRPLRTWTGAPPSAADISPFQQLGWIVAMGALGAAARVVLDGRLEGEVARRVDLVSLRFRAVSGTKVPHVLRSPRVALPASAALVTFLLSGLATTWVQAALVFAVLLLVGVARSALGSAGWWQRAARIPVLVRGVVGVALTWLLGRLLLAFTFTGRPLDASGTMLPVLVGVMTGVAVIGLCTAPPTVATTVRPPRRTPTAAVAIIVATLGLVQALGDARLARADNCSGLSDCFYTIAAALLVIALLALVIALLFTFLGPGGGLALAGGGALANAAAATAATNAAVAAAEAAAAAAAAGLILQMSSSGTPGNNQAQNKQFSDAVRRAERDLGRKLNKDEIRQVHDAISGENYGFHDIVEEILNMFGGG